MANRSVSKGVIKDIVIVGVGVLVIWFGLTLAFGTQNPFYV
ncbi:MAG: signal peptidase I, partial [Nitrosopumilus sp.]